jgi:hypothetical protein
MGNYACRELAAKYKISPAMIVKPTKAKDKRLGELVNKQVEIKQELKSFSEQEVNEINVAAGYTNTAGLSPAENSPATDSLDFI